MPDIDKLKTATKLLRDSVALTKLQSRYAFNASKTILRHVLAICVICVIIIITVNLQFGQINCNLGNFLTTCGQTILS